MALPRRINNLYTTYQNTAAFGLSRVGTSTIATNINEKISYVALDNFDFLEYLQERHSDVKEANVPNQEIYDDDVITKRDSETVLVDESVDIPIDYMPAESELRHAQLLNIPTRGFCVSADLEELNADSYIYSQDSEEFAPPIV